MNLIYTNYQTPSRFQIEDEVEGEITYCPNLPSGTRVQGVVINFVNRDPQLLNQGRVEIRFTGTFQALTDEDNYGRAWIQADKVLSIASNRLHPLTDIQPVTKYEWTCACGDTGSANTEDEAREAHRTHAHRA